MNHASQWDKLVSGPIPIVSHAAPGGRGHSRPSSGIGGAGTPFKTSISQYIVVFPRCVMGFSSTVPLSTDGVANSWSEMEVVAASPPSKER